MSRRKEKQTFGNVELHVTQLGPMKALEILPDIARIFIPVLNELAKNPQILKKIEEARKTGVAGITVADAFAMRGAAFSITEALAGKMLARLAPEVLALSTAVVTPTNLPAGATPTPVTIKLDSSDAIDTAFGENIALLLPAVIFAVRVSFADFLSVPGLFAGGTQTP